MADDDRTLAIAFAAKLDKMQRDVDKGLGVVVRKLEKMENDAKKSFDKIESSAGRAFTNAAKSAAAFAAVFVTGALVRNIKQSLSLLDDLGDSAARLGVGVDVLFEFQQALTLSGGKAEEVVGSFDTLQQKLGALIGQIGKTKATKDALEAIGISRETIAMAASVEEKLALIADGISKVEDRAVRAAIADKLGIRALLPLLEKGSAGMKDLTGQFTEAGQRAAEFAAKAGPLADSMDVLEKNISLSAASIYTKLGPALLYILGVIDSVLAGLADIGRDQTTGEKLADLIARRDELTAPARATNRGAANNIAGTPSGAAGPVTNRGQANMFGPEGEVGRINRQIEALTKLAESEKAAATEQAKRLNPVVPVSPVEEVKKEAEAVNDLTDEYEKLVDQVRRLVGNDLKGKISTAMDIMGQAQDAKAVVDEQIRSAAEEQKRAFTDAFVYALQSGDVKGAVLSFVDFFARKMYEDLASSIYDALKSGLSGGGGDWLSAIIGAFTGGGGGGAAASGFASSFGGARAGGGPVSAGMSYIVGEKRPELFVPDVNGRIIPEVPSLNGRGGSMTFSPYIDARGATAEVIPMLRSELRRLESQFASFAGGEPERVKGYVADSRQRGIAGRRW